MSLRSRADKERDAEFAEPDRLARPDPRSVRTASGQVLRAAADWILVPPGDAGLTRRIKAAGPSWTVQEKVGRRTLSRGVWANKMIVDSIRRDLAAERATPEYAAKQQAAARRRDREQAEYVTDFRATVLQYLHFHPRYRDLATRRPTPSPRTPRPSAAEPSREPSGSRSRSAPKLPSSPGCVIKRRRMTRCTSRVSAASVAKSAECSQPVPNRCSTPTAPAAIAARPARCKRALTRVPSASRPRLGPFGQCDRRRNRAHNRASFAFFQPKR
jgi:hypothetical protein